MDRLEHKVPPPVFTLLAGLVVWFIGRLDVDGSLIERRAVDLAAVAIGAVGLALGVAGLAGFARARTTFDPHRIEEASSLVIGGVYRITRNPMYLGMVLLVAAWALRVGTVIGLVVGPALLVATLTRLQIRPEERFLSRHFGADYDRYRATVRRWI